MIDLHKNRNMNTRKVLGVIGIISAIMGLTGTIPAGLQNSVPLLIGSGFFVILGVILMAIGFND
ncbi:MAG TPA: hypothetical protein VJB94_03160 [Candidatus Nanoarchaeia archaeon]|nr:hypothetical protein [Candidatus Nanoarchaeia archaeon]